VDGDVSRNVGSLLGRNAELEKTGLVDGSFVCRIFEVEAFVGQMPQVLVLGVVGLLVDLERDVVLFRVLDLLLTAVEFPESPRSDNVHVRSKCLDGQLETYLIVALTGAAMADSVCAFLQCDLNDALCNDRSCKGGAEQVLLVGCASLHGRDDEVVHKFLVQVFDVQFGSAGLECLFFQTVQLGALTDVAGNCDNLTAVVLLEPRNQNRGVKAAGIC